MSLARGDLEAGIVGLTRGQTKKDILNLMFRFLDTDSLYNVIRYLTSPSEEAPEECEIKQEETEVACSQYCKSEPLMERLGKLKDLKEKFQTLSFFKDKNLTFEQVEAIQELLK